MSWQQTSNGRLTMTRSLWILGAAALLVAVCMPPVRAGSGSPKATDGPSLSGLSHHGVIHQQVLRDLIVRFDQAAKAHNYAALLAVDRDLKKVIGAAVRSGNVRVPNVETVTTTQAKAVGPKAVGSRSWVSPTRSARQLLHRVAFRLRPLYAQVDQASLNLKRKLIQSLLGSPQ